MVQKQTNNLDESDVGLHFLVGLRPGSALHRLDREMLRRLRPAGVVLFKSNFVHGAEYSDWLESHRRLIAEIRDCIDRDRTLIAIDHEAGRVVRTPAPIAHFPAPTHWRSSNGKIGAYIGKELSSLGINLNFAPVLDINTNPENPVIGDRSFGCTAEEVFRAAGPFLEAMEKNGVRGCGKHFPGHGDTDADSHHVLPKLNLTRSEIRARELLPFRSAIDNSSLGMIMTAHLHLPNLDDLPVTLSRKLTRNLLRYHCKFRGVIVSDDVGMGAMKGRLKDAGSVAQFFNAGNDMMLVCSHNNRRTNVERLAVHLQEAVHTDGICHEELGKSKRRIKRFMQNTCQNEVKRLTDRQLEAHNALAQKLTRLASTC